MDADGVENDFAGDFGTYSDSATFTFALTFTRALETTSLENSLVFNITSQPAAESITTSTDFSTDGTNFVYTFYYEIPDMYGASGTYAIEFISDIVDDAGNTIAAANLNAILNGVCSSGTCQFENNPLTLLAATFDPAAAVVLSNTEGAPQNLELTLTFSEPVSFTSTIKDDFYLQYATAAGTELASTADLESTLKSIAANTLSTTTDNVHYTEHVLTIQDTNSAYWAQLNYIGNVGESSLLALFFENLDDVNGVDGVTYIESFQTATAVLATLPTTIQDGTSSSSTQFSVITQIPELISAAPAAASFANSQNNNPDHFESGTPVARHVAFDFNETLLQSYGTSAGMHILYRTEDNAFTNADANTAPYYGADGGLFLSGADLDSSNIGYHVCPPFSDRIHGPRAGSPSPNAPISYNPNRLKIHYIAIPYLGGSSQMDDTEISSLTPFTVDFSTSADYLSDTEPCVRSTFYNQGVGQYGYIVDTDREEEMMLIANAMLQDQDGYNLDDARLPLDQHDNVYFDLYTRDFYNDSWQKDLTITLAQVLADLKGNIGAGTRHDITGIDISFGSVGDSADDTIFASRFINTINARFLNNVFLDDLTAGDIKGYDLTINDYMDNEITPIFEAHLAAGIGSPNIDVVDTSIYDTNMNPYLHDAYASPEDTSTATIAPTNQNRLVLSVGVHPAAITVNPGGGTFTPFATSSTQLLEMDSAFYGLHYGGVAGTTRPAFDYTSRHLAYVNFDLVYQLTRDPDTGVITDYDLIQIVSPFTLLKNELFTGTTLTSMRDNGEVYSAAAASIADNVFRHNFLGSSTSDGIGHYLPVGVYCRISSSSPSNSACYNDFAQMLLPDPDDGTLHERTIVSDHYLHRHVLRLDPGNYSVLDTTENGGYDLLGNLVQLVDAREDSRRPNNGNSGKVMDQHSYSSIIYNSFDRDYGHSYNDSSRILSNTRSMDGKYDGDFVDNVTSIEQSFFGLSPFAESPNSRADQILPNAFLLGNQLINYGFHFFAKPYQHSGYTADIKNYLGSGGSHNGIYDDLRFISSHLYTLNGFQTNIDYDDGGTYYKVSTGHFLPTIWEYGVPGMSSSDFQAFSPAAGPRTNLYDYYKGSSHAHYLPMAHISPTHPSHYNITNYLGGIKNTQNSNPYTSVAVTIPSLFAGRLPGMGTDTTGANEYEHDYAESLHLALAPGPSTTNLTLARTQHDWTLSSGNSPDGLYYADTRDIKLGNL